MANGVQRDDRTAEITLGVLTAVEHDSGLSQRALAGRLGIALGLVNAYIKRCVKKGHIKIKQVPPNHYAYYLTPKGFTEKSRLTVKYLSVSLRFFRRARKECAELLEDCVSRGWRRVALAGEGDLADIAALCAKEVPVTLVEIADSDVPGSDHTDAVMVVDIVAPQRTFDALAKAFPAQSIVAPAMLNISRGAPKARRRSK